MTDIKKLSEQLAGARKGSGLLQSTLAQKLGMKQSQISDIEAGKRNLRVDTLIEVSRAVGLELVLVPRSSLPAVSYIVQSSKVAEPTEPRSMYELWSEGDTD